MTIASFFTSWAGMYLAQSFLHSLIAAIIVDTSLIAWKIEDPWTRQRFRLMVVVMPILAFPLYQLMSSERGSALFRLDAYFDINRWLNIELWGGVPLGTLFLLLLAFSAVVFIVQELAPIVRHARGSDDAIESAAPAPGTSIARVLESLPAPRPAVHVLQDREFVIFSSTGSDPAVYVSTGLIETYTEEELRAALAHEFGHIRRSKRPLMVLVFLLRVLMFYNPVILMEFRRIVQEEEKICDDLAVDMTGDRAALAGALKKFFFGDDGHHHEGNAAASEGLRDRIEEYSHTLLIEERIVRLEGEQSQNMRGIAVFPIVLVTVLVVNYYIV